MATKPEQLEKYDTPGSKKYLKREVRRWRRRLAKKLLADTPTEHYKGYS